MEHIPVLVDELLSILNRPETEIVVDATLGGGGHAEAILTALKGAYLIGIDRDHEAVERSRRRLQNFGERVSVEKAHFADVGEVLDRRGVEKVDAIVMDLGVSSFHLNEPERGFSFRDDGPLDMRMDQSQKLTASEIINSANEKELALLFKKYGEERFARRISRVIVAERKKNRIETTSRLAQIIEDCAPAKVRAGKIHPATKVFQALRIAVNDELETLGLSITRAIDRLKPGGRIIVISFHSLEDRIVKRTFRDLTRRCVCPKEAPLCTCGEPGKVELVTRKSIVPGKGELSVNRRARSARLRAAQRLAA